MPPSAALPDRLLAPLPEHQPGAELAPFYRPQMAPLAAPVLSALAQGPRPEELLPPAAAAPHLQEDGYWPVETGWSQSRLGGARVFCLTPMPGVTPAMWEWWFAWHGSSAARYRLWHPQAHVDARWADGLGETGGYVGRTSLVTEYLGDKVSRFAIRFIAPQELGLDPALLARRGEVAICARAGVQAMGMEGGAMIHQLRPTADGCEMRSRFWLGGAELRITREPGPLGRAIGRGLGALAGPSLSNAPALLAHCAEEMSHLAAILPDLYRSFGPGR